MKPMTAEDIKRLRELAKNVIESKGWRFYQTSYIKGIRDAEKFHNIGVKEDK